MPGRLFNPGLTVGVKRGSPSVVVAVTVIFVVVPVMVMAPILLLRVVVPA